MSETLEEKTMSMLLTLRELNDGLSNVNDIGDATSFCEENDQIREDAFSFMGMLRSRAAKLQRRIKRTQQAKP